MNSTNPSSVIISCHRGGGPNCSSQLQSRHCCFSSKQRVPARETSVNFPGLGFLEERNRAEPTGFGRFPFYSESHFSPWKDPMGRAGVPRGASPWGAGLASPCSITRLSQGCSCPGRAELLLDLLLHSSLSCSRGHCISSQGFITATGQREPCPGSTPRQRLGHEYGWGGGTRGTRRAN